MIYVSWRVYLMYIVADDSIVVIHLLIQQMIFINCHSSDDEQMKYNLLIS